MCKNKNKKSAEAPKPKKENSGRTYYSKKIISKNNIEQITLISNFIKVRIKFRYLKTIIR